MCPQTADFETSRANVGTEEREQRILDETERVAVPVMDIFVQYEAVMIQQRSVTVVTVTNERLQ